MGAARHGRHRAGRTGRTPRRLTGATVLITGLTIRRGDRGIYDRGTMTLTRSTVRDNDLGIHVDLDIGSPGGMTLDHSWVRDNSAIGINNEQQRAAGQGFGHRRQRRPGHREQPAEVHDRPPLHHPGQRWRRHPQQRQPARRGLRAARQPGWRHRERRLRDHAGLGRGRQQQSRQRGWALLAAPGPGAQGDISDSVIEGNHAGSLGGGIYGWGGGVNLDLDRVVIKDNIANKEGGGIFEAGINGGYASLTDVTFSNNTPERLHGLLSRAANDAAHVLACTPIRIFEAWCRNRAGLVMTSATSELGIRAYRPDGPAAPLGSQSTGSTRHGHRPLGPPSPVVKARGEGASAPEAGLDLRHGSGSLHRITLDFKPARRDR